MRTVQRQIIGPEDLGRMVRRMAVELAERTSDAKHLGLVGIRRGGEPLAQWLAEAMRGLENRTIPVGTVDISLYRDDHALRLPDPKIGPSEIDFEVDGWDIILVDDVLQSGRTVRAAIDCLFDFGRPRRVWLAVLCDRGGRELPVAPDVVGRVLQVAPADQVHVHADGSQEDGVFVVATAVDGEGEAQP